MKKIKVVAAAIFSTCGKKIFIAKRADNAHQGGLWEFPGGKKEQGETPQQALVRELNEELGIAATVMEPLIKLSHDYGDKQVELDVYRVTQFTGKPHGAEGQITQWVALKDIREFEFPAANQEIINRLLSAH